MPLVGISNVAPKGLQTASFRHARFCASPTETLTEAVEDSRGVSGFAKQIAWQIGIAAIAEAWKQRTKASSFLFSSPLNHKQKQMDSWRHIPYRRVTAERLRSAPQAARQD